MKTDDMILKDKSRPLKVVLVLFGEGQVGKSETLTAVGNELRSQSRFFYEQKGQSESHDRMMLLKYGRYVIGICTAGDNESIIDRNFKFVSRGCSVAILAARVDGSTDMLSYIKNKVKKMRSKIMVGVREKYDAKTRSSRLLARAACIDRFVKALNCSGGRKMVGAFEAR